jgi:hypothetical protein
MDPVKKKELKRALAKRGKSKRLTRTEQFLKRQGGSFPHDYTVQTILYFSVDKVWLETHIWHAKRMHMETKWGYRLVCPRTVDYRVGLISVANILLLSYSGNHTNGQIRAPISPCCDARFNTS